MYKWLAPTWAVDLHSHATIMISSGIQMVSITKVIANKCIQIYLLYKHFMNHYDFKVNEIQFYFNMSIYDLLPLFINKGY